jgi:hypothetical protein
MIHDPVRLLGVCSTVVIDSAPSGRLSTSSRGSGMSRMRGLTSGRTGLSLARCRGSSGVRGTDEVDEVAAIRELLGELEEGDDVTKGEPWE